MLSMQLWPKPTFAQISHSHSVHSLLWRSLLKFLNFESHHFHWYYVKMVYLQVIASTWYIGLHFKFSLLNHQVLGFRVYGSHISTILHQCAFLVFILREGWEILVYLMLAKCPTISGWLLQPLWVTWLLIFLYRIHFPKSLRENWTL